MALIIVNHIEGKMNNELDQIIIKNQSVYEILSNAVENTTTIKNSTDKIR